MMGLQEEIQEMIKKAVDQEIENIINHNIDCKVDEVMKTKNVKLINDKIEKEMKKIKDQFKAAKESDLFYLFMKAQQLKFHDLDDQCYPGGVTQRIEIEMMGTRIDTIQIDDKRNYFLMVALIKKEDVKKEMKGPDHGTSNSEDSHNEGD